MSKVYILLAVCGVTQSLSLGSYQSPVHSFLSSIGSPYEINGPGAEFARYISSGSAAQRLPVNGFGLSQQYQEQEDGADPSFSNPLPPVQTPAAQTCSVPPASCPKSRYRSIDGSCNNLVRPTWGTPESAYGRLVPYKYGDGISSIPRAASGAELPNAREISLRFFQDRQLIDPIWTLVTMQWGQIITHDMSLTAGVAQTHKDLVTCCNDNGQLAPNAASNPTCAPILIPPNDPVHAPQRTQCMNFVRTTTTLARGCSPPNVPAEPITTVTAFMDMSLVYGSTVAQATPIRAFQGGRLLTLRRGGREWPPQDPNITLTCESAQSPNEPCYLAGDIRVNQSPQLAVLQVMLMREHNRIADILASLNPQWNDETIYQEARRILIAECQKINYYEYLPILLGFENMVKNKLLYPGVHGYVNDYNPNVDPSVLDEHATAAFRHFHTLIRGFLKLFTEVRSLLGTIRLSDWFNRPLILEINTAFDDLARGFTVQAQDYSDQWWDSEITQFLFKRNNTFGSDLRAIDIQRGRDHGLGSYIATRAACGLPVPKSFHDLLDFISPENVQGLQNTYQSILDVDLVVAGSLERNVPGALAGPTFLCILTEQFYRTRVGDRYFFENGADQEIAFTPSQLDSIREGASLARLICDNTDGVRAMQLNAFQRVGNSNPLVSCEELPSIDLTLWQENNYEKK
ncbi:unnamed protein product [Diatraea saccharalis]|uniref:Peroxidase n=1 Tax=Diatraea saccharalis TaxID=40085 RepID=A0A9N9R070_9NEOP|nr:unnamed protein product [Diatraea saccharalis]